MSHHFPGNSVFDPPTSPITHLVSFILANDVVVEAYTAVMTTSDVIMALGDDAPSSIMPMI